MKQFAHKLTLPLAAFGSLLLATAPAFANLATATQLMERQAYAQAEPMLREIVAAGHDAQAEYLLGFLLIETYRFAEAEEHLSRAVTARPNEPHWLMVLAKSQLEQGKNLAAGTVLERAIKLDPKPAYYHAHAMTALNAGDLDAAESSLRKCVELDPKHGDALARLGGLLIDAGRSDEGTPYLERARTVNPGNTDAIYRLGAAYRYAGRLDEAEVLLTEVVERVPGHVGALHNLSRVLIAAGKKEQAQAVLQQFREMSALRDEIDFNAVAVRKNPKNIDGRLHLATLHLRAGRTQDALTGLLAARSIAPQDARIYRLLAEAFRGLGDETNSRRAEQFAIRLEESGGR